MSLLLVVNSGGHFRKYWGGGVSAEGMSLLGGLGAWSINSSHLICDIRNVEYCFLFVFKQCHFVLLCCLFVVVIVLPFLKMKTCLCFHFSKRKLQLKLFGGGRLPPLAHPSVRHWWWRYDFSWIGEISVFLWHLYVINELSHEENWCYMTFKYM